MKMLSTIRFWILFATFVGIVAGAAKLNGGESFLFLSFKNNEDTPGNHIGSELVPVPRSNSITRDNGERNEEPPASPELVIDVHSISANPPSSPNPPPPQQTPSLTTMSKIRVLLESLVLEIESIQPPSSSSDQQPPPLRERLVSWFTENRNAFIISGLSGSVSFNLFINPLLIMIFFLVNTLSL